MIIAGGTSWKDGAYEDAEGGPLYARAPRSARSRRNMQPHTIVAPAHRSAGEGTGVVTNGTMPVETGSASWALAAGEGARISRIAASLRNAPLPPAPAPPVIANVPPAWGEQWSATTSTNLTQVGYDAGLVVVNFTGECVNDARQQKMKSVYGDFYTVLTRCDLGYEFTIAPKSRGSNCLRRKIGVDVDARICAACACPFCVRDTNGSFAVGTGGVVGVTAWDSPYNSTRDGIAVVNYHGRAESAPGTSGGKTFDLETVISYDAATGTVPMFVSISHPLWVSTAAKIEFFSNIVDDDAFDVPDKCPHASSTPHHPPRDPI